MHMKQVHSIPEYCYPIDYCVDYDRLYNSIIELLSRLGCSMDQINQRCRTEFGYTINLTHQPGLIGTDRWAKFTGSHYAVARHGVREVDFVQHLAEAQDLYIGQVIRDIYRLHGGHFQGRAQLIWLGANQQYNMHKDPHTPNRYHIPVVTNELCYWKLAKQLDDEPVTLHMPADGRVWYLNPVAMYHTFINESNVPRLHVLLTSGF